MKGKVDYIGIENEVASFDNGKWVTQESLKKSFNKIKNGVYSCDIRERPYYTQEGISRSEMIRSSDGNVYYLDTELSEITTPPIRLTKGFSSRLTDMVMIGREKIVNTMPDMEHTGYSMHWNLTAPKNYSPVEFIRDTAIPFQLFGLTPSSIGFNLRDHDTRWELLGDSIQGEGQINAAALLLGSYSKMINSGKRLNRKAYNHWQGSESGSNLRKEAFVKGRKDLVSVASNDDRTPIFAQEYLEGFYNEVFPFVEALGDKKEIENLKAFVYGKVPLEVENISFHKELFDKGMKDKGFYLPFSSDLGTTLLNFSKDKDIPLEGRMMGEMAKYQNRRDFSWDNFALNIDGELIDLSSIENVYEFFESRLK